MFFILSAGGLTILMTIVLTIRQIFFGIRPDKSSSYPTPPRALITPLEAHTLPVFGHTRFFRRYGGQLFHRFSKTWKEYGYFIPLYGRRLGSCFAIFIWAQWRVVIMGKKRASHFLGKDGGGIVIGYGDGDANGNVNDDRLKPAWAFFEPRPLLGNNCPSMMRNPDERRVLVNLFGGLMAHEKVVRFAEEFGILADEFVDKLLEGELEVSLGGRGDSACKCLKKRKISTVHPEKYLRSAVVGNKDVKTFHIGSHTLRHFSFDLINGPLLGLAIEPGQDNKEKERQKLEQEQRGYIGKMQDCNDNHLSGDTSIASTSGKSKQESVHGRKSKMTGIADSDAPSRDKILTWIRRAQNGLLGFRFTVGGKWMQIWRLNEYGRAIHARNDIINTLLSDRISKMNNMSQRPAGLNTIDPLITPNPIYTFATQIEQHIANINVKMKRRNSAPDERSLFITKDGSRIEESFTNTSESTVPSLNTFVTPPSISSNSSKKSFVTRSASPVPSLNAIVPLPSVSPAPSYQHTSPIPSTIKEDAELDMDKDASSLGTILVPYGCGQPPSTVRGMSYPYNAGFGIGVENHDQQQILSSVSALTPTSIRKPEHSRERARSDTDLYIKTDLLALFKKQEEEQAKKQGNLKKGDDQEASNTDFQKVVPNLLDDFLDQKDESGNVISQAAITDLSFLLWMSLDAGSAWTSMALQLLQHDPNALQTVRNELNYIEGQHGANFFSHLDEAQYLDAAVYEAIRLSPPFCGGMWTTGRTVELEEDGVQIPSGTHVIFAGVTTRPFDLEHVYGKKAQNLFHDYPCRQLYGFLPLDGKEIPLMVLQSKILLAAILRRCDISPQDVKKCEATKHKGRTRRRKKGYYSHSSDDESDDPISINENLQFLSCKVPQIRKLRSKNLDEIDDFINTKVEPIDIMGVTFDGTSAQLSLDPALSNQSRNFFTPDKEAGAIPVEALLNPTSSSNSGDDCSASTSDSTALEVRSFEYPDDDGFSEIVHDLSPELEECGNSISLQTAVPTPYMRTMQLNSTRAITPEECWKWFTKLPFPESLNSVTVAARNRPHEY